MKKIAILGSTGSIGTSALDVISKRPRDFCVIGLSAYENFRLLARQIKKFRPRFVSVKDQDTAKKLEKLADLSSTKVFLQEDGLNKIAAQKELELLVVATSGTVSLIPLLTALERGKNVALANKEPLVMAGEIVMQSAKTNKCRLIPVDSEHSAIFQCLQKEDPLSIKRLYLTGSGGPFRGFSKSELKKVDLSMALNHPKWKMGKKITIDSATLMNKGLEIIEARWLFDVETERIKVVVHPEAVIHSMVEFCDGSILAQMGITDMRLPIQYALDYPRRLSADLGQIDFFKIKNLTFGRPDEENFPCLKIAQDAAREGGSACCVMNAANETAVQAFLNNKIKFLQIPEVISKILKKHVRIKHPTLKEIFALDKWGRKEADLICCQL